MQQAVGTDWRILAGGVSAWFDAPSQSAGAALVSSIAGLTDGNGLPDIDLRAGGVRVRIGAVDLGPADVALAQAVSLAARDLGLSADPAALQTMRVAIGAVDQATVSSFWQTALAYEPIGTDGLGDPLRRDPAISFHRQDEPRPLRNRIHVDVVRPAEAVQTARTVVGQEPYGAYGLTLADAEGNEVDLVPGDDLPGRPATSDWQTLFGAMAYYPTPSALPASRLATAAARLADDAELPLLIDLRPDGVTIDSGKDQWEDDEHGTGPRFVALAGQIQAAARELGLSADPKPLRFVQFGIDAVDIPAVRAFWTTVLGYRHDPRPFLSDIYDPRRLGPVLLFQELDAADEERRRQRNRIHLGLVVPYDQLQARIDVAVSVGGQLLTDRTARGCTIADPEGNELRLTAQPLIDER